MDAVPARPPSPSAVPSPVMGLLQEHLPLTLLLDLALGVRSHEVYATESADLSWVPVAVAPKAS